MRRVLTFLSDFGSRSPYPAAMKAVAASITDARLIDISHDIRPHDTYEGAFTLWSVAPHFPKGTVHCAVVDPGVGTGRRGLILAAGGQWFVGPDNGLLIPAASALAPRSPRAYEITNPQYQYPKAASSTFHGRDVFAPVAAQLANGVPPEEIGRPVSDWATLALELEPDLDLNFQGGTFQEGEGAFLGRVVYIDRFGNAITDITAELLERVGLSLDQALTLRTGPHERRVRLRESYGFAEPGELCLVLGSCGLLEIAVREGSAQGALGLKVGQRLTLHPIRPTASGRSRR